METHHPKFKKLNWLLVKSFEAERLYYDASEDVQEVNLKRYLHHQSVNRNRFSYLISEKLVQEGIAPMKDWAEKGNLDRNPSAEQKALLKQKPLKHLKKCRKQDKENLQLYEEILQEKQLPKDILKMLKKQKRSILEGLKEGEKFRNGETPLVPEHNPKVISLRAI